MADKNLNYTLNLKDYFKRTMLGAQQETKRLDSQMGRLNSTISKFGKTFAAFFALNQIKNFGLAVVDSLKNYQYFSTSLKTLLYGDAAAANALQAQLITLAKTTPFTLVEVQEGSKQLLAYGFAANDIVKEMKMLGNISAAVNKPLGEIVYLFGTLKTQGRAFSKDINQFTTAGINILPQLAKQFNVVQSSIMGPGGLVESGKVGFKDVEKAFITMTSAGGQFFNLMEAQSLTVGGKISNLGDSWEQLKVNIGKSQTGIINGTVDFASRMVSALTALSESSNRVDESFKKSGLSVNNFMEGLNDRIFAGSKNKIINDYFTGGIGRNRETDFDLQKTFVKPSEKGGANALMLKSALLKEMSFLSKRFANKEISLREYQQTYSLQKSALEQINGNIGLSKMNEGSNKLGGTSNESSQAIGSPVDISGPRAQNVTINVNHLVETININSQTMAKGAQDARNQIVPAFLELLNDANQIANR